eukprot:13921-Heterococcus_DN1.PRE.2
MEHVPGGTLRDLIVNMAQLPEAVASIYTHQLLLGLAFLHSCGAAHHTLCAANVLVSHESGRESVVLKLVNFGNGNSKLLSSSSSSISGHTAPEVHTHPFNT